MTQSDLDKLKKQLAKPKNAKAALGDFLQANPDAADALHAAGVNINNPLLALLLPILLQFLQDWLSKQKNT